MRISLINQRGISHLFRDNGRRKISWNTYIFLVGGLEHEFYFPLYNIRNNNPIDELIFFKMVIAPPTRM